MVRGILALGTALALLMLCSEPAWAGSSEDAARHVATTEAAVAAAAEDDTPSFGLPPIVVQVKSADSRTNKTISFKAALVFDEVDRDRIEDSMSVTKTLVPRIMDSVITGLQRNRFAALPDDDMVDKLVIRYSNVVLNPYGVRIKGLKMQYLGTY